MDKLGIVAGGGVLPARLIAACRNRGREVFVLAVKGHAEEALLPADVAREWIAIGQAGRGIDIMRREGVRDLVMVGRVKRPSLRELRPDWRTLRFFAKVGFDALGDNGLLSAVVAELEREGFRVVGIDQVLGGLLAPAGVIGHRRPDDRAEADIAAGIAAARAHGAADRGQAVVVRAGVVLDREDEAGTDALIRRAAPAAGAILIKTEKPGQERRVDLPTIGPATVAAAAAAGFAGIAVEAGSTLIVDREQCIADADAAGLFLVGVA